MSLQSLVFTIFAFKKSMNIYEYIFTEFKKGELLPFYQNMYPELLAYATRLLGDEFAFQAEDCVQDAIFKAYQQTKTFTSPLQWKIFLYTCLRNEAISVLRKGKAQRNYLSQTEVDGTEDLSLDFIEQETITLLYEAINTLPEKYRTIFELSFEKGLKNAEIAQLLHVAEITVKKQKGRLIELLREKLKGKMDEASLGLLLYLLENQF